MSFYDLLKSKYLSEVPTDKVEPNSLQKIIETNIWPSDFIEQEGVMKSIYSVDITLQDIFDFFKQRMPWLKFQINNQEVLDKNPGELLAVKFVCFHQLAGLLSEVHSNFRKAFEHSLASDLKETINGVTIH